MADQSASDRPPQGRRGPDPDRPGTVYRARPRILRWRRPADSQAWPTIASGQPGQADGSRSEPPDQHRGPASTPWPAGQPTRPPSQPVPVYQAAAGPGGPPAQAIPPYQPADVPGQPIPPYRPLGRTSPTAGRRRRRWPWIVAVVIVLLIVYPLSLGLVAWRSLSQISALPASGGPAASPGRTFLVVGSDSRQDLTRAERDRLGTGQAAGQRADTIMLLHVPAGGGPTVLVSVPRDSYVAIPGHGKNKINAAYAFGGPQLLVRTIEQSTGLHVDDYVETGLGGYANLVDAIGGVRICVKRAMNDKEAHINLRVGCQQMDGKTALGYARARYSDPLGDLGRVQRQREVLAAIAGKTLSPSVLLLPWRAFPASSAGGAALTVDRGTTPAGVAGFVLAMRAVSGGNGLSLTVPVARADLNTPAGLAVEWNSTQAKALFADLRSDDTGAIRSLSATAKPTAAG